MRVEDMDREQLLELVKTDQAFVEIVKHLGTLDIQGGDVLIVTPATKVCCDQLDNIHRTMRALFPDNRTIVSEPGIEFGVVRKGLHPGTAERIAALEAKVIELVGWRETVEAPPQFEEPRGGLYRQDRPLRNLFRELLDRQPPLTKPEQADIELAVRAAMEQLQGPR